MTLGEKIGLLSPNASISHNTCNCHTAGSARLGLPNYMWLDETNSGASAACLAPGQFTGHRTVTQYRTLHCTAVQRLKPRREPASLLRICSRTRVGCCIPLF